MQLSHKIIAHNSPVARLYELQSQTIFAYLRRQTSSREDAEDVLVEVFVAALETETLNRLSENEQIAWLWRVAHNKSVDAYRRSQVRQGVDLSLAEDQSDDENKAPEQVALQRESASLLHSQLEKLSPVQREARQNLPGLAKSEKPGKQAPYKNFIKNMRPQGTLQGKLLKFAKG